MRTFATTLLFLLANAIGESFFIWLSLGRQRQSGQGKGQGKDNPALFFHVAHRNGAAVVLDDGTDDVES